MERVAKGVNVGAELYDKDGKLVARITNNEFHALTGTGIYIERQSNLSTLVVKRRTRHLLFWATEDELLYVRYLNSNTILARGIFSCPGYPLFAFTDDRRGVGGVITNSCFVGGRAAFHIN